VFVAGGTGVIGRRLVPLLVARGHEVVATTTRPEKRAAIESQGATAVLMDGLDAASVGEAVATAEPDVIVHQMTSIPQNLDVMHPEREFATTTRLRTEGLDHLVAAADSLGGVHLVAQSYASWNGIRHGGWVKTEADPLDPEHLATPSLQHIDDVVLPRGGAVLRYGWLYGPGASDGLVGPIRKRQFPLVGGGAAHTSWVHVDDAASATVLAVEQRAGGVFNIVDDDPAAVSEWLPYLASRLGAKPPLRVPAWVLRMAGGGFVVWMMTEGRAFSNAKAKRELGWQPAFASWRDGFATGLE
jgi:nucleoside-diphosphate-sugar epimerase